MKLFCTKFNVKSSQSTPWPFLEKKCSKLQRLQSHLYSCGLNAKSTSSTVDVMIFKRRNIANTSWMRKR